MGQAPQTPSTSSGGLEPNIAALLGYLFWPIAIVWLVIDPYKQDRFVRFHAMQALGLVVALFALTIGLGIVSIVLAMIPGIQVLAAFIWPLFWLAIFVVWIIAMVKAYQRQMWKLPVIGPFAEKHAG